jgi:uncharacterized membrane protein YgcG
MHTNLLARRATSVLIGLLLVASLSGCGRWRRVRSVYQQPPPATPLGTINDSVWQNQEGNAELSDFVIYMHEFQLDRNPTRLNDAGMDHVKEIAARLHTHPEFLVLIQRSLTSIKPDTEFEYPVNPNPEMDMARRDVVVRALTAMGVPNADQRVVVSHALTPGQKATEAQRDYNQALNSFGGMGGFGGGFGFGGFGGFGGGGFGGGGGFF